MSDEVARTAHEHPTADDRAPSRVVADDEQAPRPRTPVLSMVFRQVGTLAGGALLGQSTWGTPWFAAVVAAVLVVEGLIVWDARHPRRA